VGLWGWLLCLAQVLLLLLVCRVPGRKGGWGDGKMEEGMRFISWIELTDPRDFTEKEKQVYSLNFFSLI
jgi:hypothetical protein